MPAAVCSHAFSGFTLSVTGCASWHSFPSWKRLEGGSKMRRLLLALAVTAPLIALDSAPAAAFGWGWDRGYGYYGYAYAPYCRPYRSYYYSYRPYYGYAPYYGAYWRPRYYGAYWRPRFYSAGYFYRPYRWYGYRGWGYRGWGYRGWGHRGWGHRGWRR